MVIYFLEFLHLKHDLNEFAEERILFRETISQILREKNLAIAFSYFGSITLV